ncbi:MAG: hypothetical protein V3V31_04035 [Methylococcales bacterium]
MEQPSTLETILAAGVIILVLFWWGPGIKGALQQSQNADKDWKGFLIPIFVVILFVVFLVKMV